MIIVFIIDTIIILPWPSFLVLLFNVKVGGLNEVTHAHKSLLVAHLTLLLARWCALKEKLP